MVDCKQQQTDQKNHELHSLSFFVYSETRIHPQTPSNPPRSSPTSSRVRESQMLSTSRFRRIRDPFRSSDERESWMWRHLIRWLLAAARGDRWMDDFYQGMYAVSQSSHCRIPRGTHPCECHRAILLSLTIHRECLSLSPIPILSSTPTEIIPASAVRNHSRHYLRPSPSPTPVQVCKSRDGQYARRRSGTPKQFPE